MQWRHVGERKIEVVVVRLRLSERGRVERCRRLAIHRRDSSRRWRSDLGILVDRSGAGEVDQRRHSIPRHSYSHGIHILESLRDDTARRHDGGRDTTARSSTLDDERFVAVGSVNAMAGCDEQHCGEREQSRYVRTT
jgi:hypothetical protein